MIENADVEAPRKSGADEKSTEPLTSGCPLTPCSHLLYSLLIERAHSEENPTRFESSIDHSDGSATWQFLTSIKVTPEENAQLMASKSWARNITIKGKSVVAQIDPNYQ